MLWCWKLVRNTFRCSFLQNDKNWGIHLIHVYVSTFFTKFFAPLTLLFKHYWEKNYHATFVFSIFPRFGNNMETTRRCTSRSPLISDINTKKERQATLSDTHREKLVLYWIQSKNSLKYKVGGFWRFPYIYTIN